MRFGAVKTVKNQEKTGQNCQICLNCIFYWVIMGKSSTFFYIGYLLQNGLKYGIITKLDVR